MITSRRSLLAAFGLALPAVALTAAGASATTTSGAGTPHKTATRHAMGSHKPAAHHAVASHKAHGSLAHRNTAHGALAHRTTLKKTRAT